MAAEELWDGMRLDAHPEKIATQMSSRGMPCMLIASQEQAGCCRHLRTAVGEIVVSLKADELSDCSIIFDSNDPAAIELPCGVGAELSIRLFAFEVSVEIGDKPAVFLRIVEPRAPVGVPQPRLKIRGFAPVNRNHTAVRERDRVGGDPFLGYCEHRGYREF